MNPWLLLGLAAAAGLALSAASSANTNTSDASADAVEAAQRIFSAMHSELQREGGAALRAQIGAPDRFPIFSGTIDDTTRAWITATQRLMQSQGITAPTTPGQLDPNTRRYLATRGWQGGLDVTGTDEARRIQLRSALLAGTQAGNGLEGLGRF